MQVHDAYDLIEEQFDRDWTGRSVLPVLTRCSGTWRRRAVPGREPGQRLPRVPPRAEAGGRALVYQMYTTSRLEPDEAAFLLPVMGCSAPAMRPDSAESSSTA